MCLGLDVGGQPRRSADRAAGRASGPTGGEVRRLPRRGMSPRRFLGPPPVRCPQRLARGDSNSRPALKPESGGSRGNAGSHPFPSA
jgi:hypothetical protein